MTRIAKLEADLVANTSRFEAGFKRADNVAKNSQKVWDRALNQSTARFNKFNGEVNNLSNAFGKLSDFVTGFAGGALGALIGGGGLVLLAKGFLSAASAIDDTAQRLQIGAEQLQKYQYAAKLAGIENDQLEGALTKLNAKIADGSLKYDNTTQAFDSIAEAVKNASSDMERAAIVNDAFGAKMGAKMLPMLTNGVSGLRDFGDEAVRTGNVLSEDLIKKSAEFEDTLDILGGTIKKNVQSGFLDELVNGSSDLKDLYSDPEFAQNMRNIGGALGYMAEKALEAVSAFGGLIGKYKELNTGSYGLDDKFFSFLRGIDESRGYTPKTVTGKGQYGPSQPYGPELPDEIATYRSSKSNKDSEAAAKKAADEAERRAKATADLLNGLSQENVLLETRNRLRQEGYTDAQIEREIKAIQLANQMRQQGIVLTQEQKAQLDTYLDSIQKQTELQEVLDKQQKDLEEKERNRQQFLNQLAASFESGFEDAIVGGEKLSDVLNALLQDMIKLILRTQVLQPMMESLFGGKSSGGGGSGLFGDIFGGLFSGLTGGIGNLLGGGSSGVGTITWDQVGIGTALPSFDVGTNYVPNDMIANIHKGEMIIPADEAAALRAGSGGSGVSVVQNITIGEGVSTQVRQEVAKMLPELKRATVSAVEDSRLRGQRV